MSGGRSYAKKDLTPEERLVEVERKYEVIQQRIQAYDAIIERQNEVEALLPQLNKMIWSCNDYIMKLEAQLKELAESSGIRIGLLKNDIDKFQALLDTVATERANLFDAVKKLKEYFLQHEVDSSLQIEILKANQEGQFKEIANDVAEISKFQAVHGGKIYDLQNHFASADKAINSLIADHSKVPDMEAKFYLVFDEVKKALESFKQENGIRHVENMRILEGLIAKAKGELKMDLQTAKDEILGTPTSNAQVKAQIMQKLEMATLDASNACIKASNVDQQVKLLEKKIESVRLQIKKDELSRKE